MLRPLEDVSGLTKVTTSTAVSLACTWLHLGLAGMHLALESLKPAGNVLLRLRQCSAVVLAVAEALAATAAFSVAVQA